MSVGNATGECSICFEDFEDSATLPQDVLICGHIFHRKCIQEWFNRTLACPFCRELVTVAVCNKSPQDFKKCLLDLGKVKRNDLNDPVYNVTYSHNAIEYGGFDYDINVIPVGSSNSMIFSQRRSSSSSYYIDTDSDSDEDSTPQKQNIQFIRPSTSSIRSRRRICRFCNKRKFLNDFFHSFLCSRRSPIRF